LAHEQASSKRLYKRYPAQARRGFAYNYFAGLLTPSACGYTLEFPGTAAVDSIGAREFHQFELDAERVVGVKKSGRGRRKLGRKKRRMRSRIRHRKG
jgi:hypothetical protein